MIPGISIAEANPDEVRAFLSQVKKPQVAKIFGVSFQIEGHIHVVCRELDGEPVWEVDQPNLITDMGRRFWMLRAFLNGNVATSPSSETPSLSRYSLPDNGSSSSSQSSGAITPSNNSPTNTKTYSTTFGTPSSNRTIGTIALGNYFSQFGLGQIVCYSVISPAKVQTTSQTLELTYRLTMTPVV